MDNYENTFQIYNKVAEAYQDKFMYLDLYNNSYDLFCLLIEKQNPSILEIGCGPGNITKYILAKRNDFKIHGIDMAPNMIRHAKENNPTATFSLMDCREIHNIKEQFDAILCGFCIPYLTKEDCYKFIKDSSNLLIKGGILYFSLIEDSYDKSEFLTGSTGDKIFIYYHEITYLQEYLKEANFEIEMLQRIDYDQAPKAPAIHLIIIAKKK